MRAEFEFYLSKKLSANKQNTPVVTLVLGGSSRTLNTLRHCIDEYQTPCIFIESCQESSEFFSNYFKNENDYKKLNFTDKQIKDKINECFKTSDIEKEEIFGYLTSILNSKNLSCISICHENENLDKVIIKALSRLNKGNNFHHLSLALAWNRIDLAKEYLGNLNQINIVRPFSYFARIQFFYRFYPTCIIVYNTLTSPLIKKALLGLCQF